MANKVIRKNANYRVIRYGATGDYQVIGKREGYWIPEGSRTSDKQKAVNLYRKLSRRKAK